MPSVQPPASTMENISSFAPAQVNDNDSFTTHSLIDEKYTKNRRLVP